MEIKSTTNGPKGGSGNGLAVVTAVMAVIALLIMAFR